MFQEEMDFFRRNQSELVDQYKGQVLVIRGSEIVGAYGSALDAFTEAVKKYAPGTFMIQPCQPGPDAYTVTVSSLGILQNNA
jgi:hypothetical protein